ncbi:GNAT family N-acetyltransferase [Lentzea jiangxiensis]|uniref:GNAT family N-acetyltransferase n=1 Tax=Lentzea jiangxiensis TaxID=641025 RepID=UPI001FE226CC|nr:GNAT family N-acetyltransferase [Lentzea jiangxiensis]
MHLVDDDPEELDDPCADLERASLAAFGGDVAVGYTKIQHHPTASEVHRVSLDGGVHPAYRRRGIGTRLVRAGIDAAKVLHALHHPALELAIDVFRPDRIAELVQAVGFKPVRHHQRWSTAFPTFRLPPIRGSSRGRRRTTRSSGPCGTRRTGTTGARCDARRTLEEQGHQPDVPASASFLLRDAGTAVGVLATMDWEADTETTGIHDAHFMVIGTLPSHRDRGVASALIAHALHTVSEQGYDRALLTVDSANAHGRPGSPRRPGSRRRSGM